MSDITTLMMGAAGQVGGGYQISRSLRFNRADDCYLDWYPSGAGNQTKWTWAGWIKRCSLGTEQHIFEATSTEIYFASLNYQDSFHIRNASTIFRGTEQLFRDTSAFLHLCLVWDTGNATPADRCRIYVNGVQVTSFHHNNDPTLNQTLSINSTNLHRMGNYAGGGSYQLDGYLADVYFLDGVTPGSATDSDGSITGIPGATYLTTFGEFSATTGVWTPKAYSGSYGTNGFHLDFSDNSSTTALGYDAAGSNDWTPNNFSVTAGAGNDSLVDSPTQYGTDTGAGGEVRGNYATLNPLKKKSAATLSNGNLALAATSATYVTGISTISPSSGNYYMEMLCVGSNTARPWGIGVVEADCSADASITSAKTYFVTNNSSSNVVYYVGSSVTATLSTSSTWADGDIISLAWNVDSGKFWVGRNGVWFPSSTGGTVASDSDVAAGNYPTFTISYFNNTNPQVFPAFVTYDTSATVNVNFGQRPFAYTAPSGFKALCTTNLPDPTVLQGDDYFNTVLYTGTGSSLGVTGVGFQPDFVWIKERSGAADHGLYDAVRGVQQQLESNTTTDETTESTGLTAFGSDGFTVGSLAQVNTSTDTYVAWNWKESTVSKFDIVTYTGNGTARTISHNLGVVPNMIIVKARTTASTDQGWPVYHSANTANPETDYLLLNSTAATADLDTVWNDTAPTSSVFSVGTNALVNANNDTYVAYLFANVAGFSAFGSYTGNGADDGPFIYFGFRPAFFLVKRSSASGEGWWIYDDKRDTFNIVDNILEVNSSNAEISGGTYPVDFLSNGLKIRGLNALLNTSGATYVFMALASNPFKYSLAR